MAIFISVGGDGQTDDVVTGGTGKITKEHTYATPGRYVVRLTSNTTPTAYATYTSLWTPGDGVFGITTKNNLTEIHGDLSAVFPTLGNGTQPLFSTTFQDCGNLTGSLPPNLFAHLRGDLARHQFAKTFQDSGITGPIPSRFFGNIGGAPQLYGFGQTFKGCSGLTGQLPDNLFANISGTMQGSMYGETFMGCSGLTGYVPSQLFSGVTPAANPFSGFANTFTDCTGLLDHVCPVGTVDAPHPYVWNGNEADDGGESWDHVAYCTKI